MISDRLGKREKMTPALASSALNVVAIETESNTASTATFRLSTPARISCSTNGIPSLA